MYAELYTILDVAYRGEILTRERRTVGAQPAVSDGSLDARRIPHLRRVGRALAHPRRQPTIPVDRMAGSRSRTSSSCSRVADYRRARRLSGKHRADLRGRRRQHHRDRGRARRVRAAIFGLARVRSERPDALGSKAADHHGASAKAPTPRSWAALDIAGLARRSCRERVGHRRLALSNSAGTARSGKTARVASPPTSSVATPVSTRATAPPRTGSRLECCPASKQFSRAPARRMSPDRPCACTGPRSRTHGPRTPATDPGQWATWALEGRARGHLIFETSTVSPGLLDGRCGRDWWAGRDGDYRRSRRHGLAATCCNLVPVDDRADARSRWLPRRPRAAAALDHATQDAAAQVRFTSPDLAEALIGVNLRATRRRRLLRRSCERAWPRSRLREIATPVTPVGIPVPVGAKL